MRLMLVLLAVVVCGCSAETQQHEASAAPAQPPVALVAAAEGTPQAPVDVTVAAPVQAPAPTADEPITTTLVMEVMPLAGKSEDEVAALLGAPVACAEFHRKRLCRYGPHEDEVLFVRGKADMITVQGMDAVPFNADALDALGLARITPDHADAHTIRWESIPGLVEVAVFPNAGGSVEYAYVKVGKH
jgi:hypothetical protein